MYLNIRHKELFFYFHFFYILLVLILVVIFKTFQPLHPLAFLCVFIVDGNYQEISKQTLDSINENFFH